MDLGATDLEQIRHFSNHDAVRFSECVFQKICCCFNGCTSTNLAVPAQIFSVESCCDILQTQGFQPSKSDTHFDVCFVRS